MSWTEIKSFRSLYSGKVIEYKVWFGPASFHQWLRSISLFIEDIKFEMREQEEQHNIRFDDPTTFGVRNDG